MQIPLTPAPAIASKKQGFTLIELTVAIGIFAILVAGAASFSFYIMRSIQEVKSQMDSSDLAGLVSTQFLAGNNPTACSAQIQLATGKPVVFASTTNANFPATPIQLTNSGGTLLLQDQQIKNQVQFGVIMTAKFVRQIPGTPVLPILNRYFAQIQITTSTVGANPKPLQKPMNIPLVVDFIAPPTTGTLPPGSAPAGTIASCTPLSTSDALLGNQHSSFDCANAAGDLVYDVNGNMLCKFTMHFINGGPQILCPLFFKASPSGQTCVPDPEILPISSCPAGGGSFCAVHSGRGFGAGCVPLPGEDGVFCTKLAATKTCPAPFQYIGSFKAPLGFGGRGGFRMTEYERCGITVSNMPCTAPTTPQWQSNNTWACEFSPTTCPDGLTTISAKPLVCAPFQSYNCPPGATNCLSCPAGWTAASTLSGRTSYDGPSYLKSGAKIADNVVCY